MIARILTLAIRYRWLVVAATVIAAAVGAWQMTRLPIDVTPDITNKQVQISTVVATLGPEEIEKRVTYPVETSLAGLDGVESTRSISRNGFSQVTAVFKEGADLYFMRQRVAERLAEARVALPEGAEPQMGPVSTGLGEVFHYCVEFVDRGPKTTAATGQPGWQADGSFVTAEGERLADETARMAYLRTVQDWIVRPQLRSVPGVADVDSLGGWVKQYVVEPDPVKLASYGVSYTELGEALERANLAVGADYVQRGGEALLVRADARLKSRAEIEQAVVANRGGVPVTVAQLAMVRIGGEIRQGAASHAGRPAVVGAALMLVGANSRVVAHGVGAKLEDIRRTLPPGVQITSLLDRSELVTAVVSTVARNLAEGAVLVVAVLFVMLGAWRAALIAALIIPLSLLLSATGMNLLHISGNLMSLGALDFGLIVDGAVIIVENSLRRLAERQHLEGRLLTREERLDEVGRASREMVRPTVYGQIVIFLVFVPCLTFQGVEGKMFSPMVVTLMLALASAFLLSLTFVPAMVALLVKGRVAETEVALVRKAKAAYEPWLRRAVARPAPFALGAVGVFVAALAVFPLLGREFMPKLDEQNLNLSSVRIASTSVDQSSAMDLILERAVGTLPEVRTVYSKVGTASLAADPMPANASDNYIILKPRSEWPAGVTSKADVVRRIEEKTSVLVGNPYEVTQPIEMRFNELIGGVRSDVAVKLYGDDLDALSGAAGQIAAVLAKVPGSSGARAGQTRGFPTFDILFDREAVARYGLTMQEVGDTVSAALAGRPAGTVFEGDRRFQVMVRLSNLDRNSAEALGALPVMLPAQAGRPRASVPLRQLARFRTAEGLNEISRDNGKRRINIETNVRGRDLGSFVAEAQKRIAAEVTLPAGAYLEWGGQYENLQAATARLAVVVPLCFLLIFGVLYLALDSAALAGVVFAAVPLALAGGVFAIWARGIPFSVSSAVGFIAVSGVAVLNGLVLINAFRQRIQRGESVEDAVIHGSLERVRPILMTALVATLGFVPMAIAHGAGAEVQRPLATVVIGGLITATALTLLVLPGICRVVLERSRPSLPPGRADIASGSA